MSEKFRTKKFRTGLSRDRALAEKHCQEYEDQLNAHPAPWGIGAKAKFNGILALLQRDSEKLEDAWKKWEILVDCIDNDTERAAEENLFNEWRSKEEFEDLMDKLDQYSGEIQSFMQAVWTHTTPAPSARVATPPLSLQTHIVPPVQNLNNYNVPAPIAPAPDPKKPKVKEVSKTATPLPVSTQPPPPPLAVVADIKDSLSTVIKIKESAAPIIDAVEEKAAPVLSSVKDTVAAVIPVLKKEVSPTANVSTACSPVRAEIPQTLAAAVPTIGNDGSEREKANNDRNTGSSQFAPPDLVDPAALKIISEELQKDCRWLNGPEFLKEPKEKWPNISNLAMDLTPIVAALVCNSNETVKRIFSETSDPTAVSASSQPPATAITTQNSDKDKEQLSKVAMIPAAPATSLPPLLQQPQTLSAQQQQKSPPLLPSSLPPIQSQGFQPSSPRATPPPTLCINPNKDIFTSDGRANVNHPIWFCWRFWLDRKMVKAVGHEYFLVYFSTVRDLLRPGGIAAIQAIYCFTEMYEVMRKSSNFIKKHMFPGGEIPSIGMINASLPAGITMSKEYNRIGKHYCVTLNLWHEKWQELRQKIVALRYSDRFIRKWEFYFVLCSALFEYGDETADPSYMPPAAACREGLVEKYEKILQHLLIYFLLVIYVTS